MLSADQTMKRGGAVTAWRRGVVWGVVGVAVVAVIAATPILLEAAAPDGMNWSQLSNVSQTYGALSVLFSAAALIGVIASLAYQARQTRITHEETQRSAHRELLLQAINDPSLMPCWEAPLRGMPMTQEGIRRQMFTNLIVNTWRTDFRLKRTGEAAMRVILDDHFQGEIARIHWERNRANWREYAAAEGDARSRRFVELADEVHARAVAAGPPIAADDYYLPNAS